ncbi:hypothetical protein [Jiangella alkaliphila]|uniref:Uncharacterized protein n=1 Tax=Jiangella alkaliphila TaxID=419479 RepID=A0A1H2LBX6_9ACTN|nr:hypothetical protein [Jiangella alkaliphila]SDU78235.1 hypothetical protein SAMN04488563_5740 [Jiangella alkaliphila]
MTESRSRTAHNLGWLFATAVVAVFAVGFQLNLPPGEQKDGAPPAAAEEQTEQTGTPGESG